jgi:hypothetical protein
MPSDFLTALLIDIFYEKIILKMYRKQCVDFMTGATHYVKAYSDEMALVKLHLNQKRILEI